MNYSIQDALKYAVSILQTQRSHLEAEILLCYILGVERIDLHIHSNRILTPDEFERFIQVLHRAKENEPIEYITHKVSFYDWEFEIFQGVLIPRPETEILVDKCNELIKACKIKNVFELGVGSGVISISLALLNPDIIIIASDINPLALKLTQKNINLLSKFDPTLLKRITLYHGDVLKEDVFFYKNFFEFWVSNPPYIANGYSLPKNVAYEPKEALFGGDDGCEILRSIVQRSVEFGIPYLACEMGWDQKEKMSQVLQDFEKVNFYKDFSGLDRGFVAKR